MFCDLNAAIISGNLPHCAIVAVGGFPVKMIDGKYCIFDTPIHKNTLDLYFREALGLGGVLTFKNPNKKTLYELGTVCLGHNHGWTLHTLTLTVLFHDVPIAVRNAFAFDRRFHLSWVEKEVCDEKVTFTATGSLKEWKKIGKRSSDTSFKKIQRTWFAQAYEVIIPTFPHYFETTSHD